MLVSYACLPMNDCLQTRIAENHEQKQISSYSFNYLQFLFFFCLLLVYCSMLSTLFGNNTSRNESRWRGDVGAVPMTGKQETGQEV